MLLLARLIAVLILVIGIIDIISPQIMKKILVFWKEGKRLYAAGVIRLLFAVVFLLVASQARAAGAIVFFGILFLVGGILSFTMKQEKQLAMIAWFEGKSDNILRLWAGLVILIGAVLLFSI